MPEKKKGAVVDTQPKTESLILWYRFTKTYLENVLLNLSIKKMILKAIKELPILNSGFLFDRI